MPNQYTRVKLHIEIEEPIDNEYLRKELTNSVFEVLKEKLPKEITFIEKLIKELDKEGA